MIAPRSRYEFPHSDHLSPSQITEYLACPECFRLARVERAPKPMNVALPIGGAVHRVVEMWRREWYLGNSQAKVESNLLDGEAIIERFVEIGAEHFDQTLEVDDETGGEILLDLAGYESIGAAKDHMVEVARYALSEIAALDSDRGLVAAELDLRDFASPWPFAMRGRVDALYGPEKDVCSMGADLKTASKQVTPAFGVALQVAIYRSFVPVPWFVDQVAKTRRPSLQTFVLSEDGDEFVQRVVLDVADRICRGDFPPRPSFLCKYAHPGPTFSVAVGEPLR